jgi:hypothetical protein
MHRECHSYQLATASLGNGSVEGISGPPRAPDDTAHLGSAGLRFFPLVLPLSAPRPIVQSYPKETCAAAQHLAQPGEIRADQLAVKSPEAAARAGQGPRLRSGGAAKRSVLRAARPLDGHRHGGGVPETAEEQEGPQLAKGSG